MKQKKIEEKKLELNFKSGKPYKMNGVIDELKKLKISDFRFGYDNHFINIYELIERFETDEEEKARKIIEQSREESERLEYIRLKEKFEPKEDLK